MKRLLLLSAPVYADDDKKEIPEYLQKKYDRRGVRRNLPMILKFRLVLISAIAGLVFTADQITKFLIESQIETSSYIAVLPFFNLVHTYNRGVSFGMFSNGSPYGPYLLSFVSLCIVAFLLALALKAHSLPQIFAFSAIIGGALGNVCDRLNKGAVTDFLDFYIGAYHWPAFNLADVAVVCGVGAVIIFSLFDRAAEARIL